MTKQMAKPLTARATAGKNNSIRISAPAKPVPVRVTAQQRAIVEALTTVGSMIGDSLTTLEAASIQLVRVTLQAEKAGFKDVKTFKKAVDDSFAPAIEAGKMGAKAAANYRGYMAAVYVATIIPEGLTDMSLQAANKAVRAANPGLYQTREPRPGSNDSGGGDEFAQEQSTSKIGKTPGVTADPLDMLTAALEQLRAQTEDEVVLNLIAGLSDLALELFEALGVVPLPTTAEAA